MMTLSPRLRARLALLAVAPVALLATPAAPAHAAVLHRGVSVWMPYWDMRAATSSTLTNANVIHTASPFWYAIQGDAKVVSNRGAGDTTLIQQLHSKGMKVIPTVTEQEGGADFGAMGTDSARRKAHVNALASIVRSRSYDGLDLDYEQLAVNPQHNDAVADRARKAMTSVAHDACATMHALHKTCVITVMARTTDTHEYWRGKLATWAYDYRALNQYADKVRIMAYGEHAPSTAPGPIGSMPWTKRVISYAQATLTPRKVELGLPAYGQDWASTGNTSVTSRVAGARAASYHVTPRFDATARELTYAYAVSGVKHTVWYGDPNSANERTALARKAGFGVAIWAAGQEQSALWPKLRAQFTY